MINLPSSSDILIIGGGATGTGIARDMAMRGASVILVERGDFCAGASGSNHGMLHSGARYASSDQDSARECAAENEILKRIAPFCIDDTGGLFVSLPEDDEDFADKFNSSCQAAGVYSKELSLQEALKSEPLLNPEITRAFEVRDAAVDPFLLVNANVAAAREFGAAAVNYTKVISMDVEEGKIKQVTLERAGQRCTVQPEAVINAAGSWAAEVAAMADQSLSVGVDKGTMAVIDGRAASRLINRLRKPADADILVPHRSATIVGTTSSPGNLNHVHPTAEEVESLLREASKMIIGLHSMRAVRAYAGIRPLAAAGGRNASRNFTITQHTEGAENLFSVVGGKLTTYRLIAEKTADAASSYLGLHSVCKTAQDELPAPETKLPLSQEVCSCEMVSQATLHNLAQSADVTCAADLMRRSRAGMGFCQSGLCAFDIVSCLEGDPRQQLQEFLAERWKGAESVLYDQQLRQEAFKAHLFKVYGIDHTGGD
ncbi:FAD-dependent oxidoreductase [Candidatus Methanomassiliicoccus intestinalis]|uniref:Glycerol-3-phosphate dehydrogenase n=1 Tax=Candidatus Methanomassiliicoccus intestinalis TaxID=1406512 RepID=A0A8J8PEL7_9ARCH|nr:MAG: hypothetical protein A3207_04435 [Candidatus Methanomassiliicoccus intestinalis]